MSSTNNKDDMSLKWQAFILVALVAILWLGAKAYKGSQVSEFDEAAKNGPVTKLTVFSVRVNQVNRVRHRDDTAYPELTVVAKQGVFKSEVQRSFGVGKNKSVYLVGGKGKTNRYLCKTDKPTWDTCSRTYN